MLVQCSDRLFYRDATWVSDTGSVQAVGLDGEINVYGIGNLTPRKLLAAVKKCGVRIKTPHSLQPTTVVIGGAKDGTVGVTSFLGPPRPPDHHFGYLKSEDGYNGPVVVTIDAKFREPRKALIAALRSGKYGQLRGRLGKGDCRCAEGVACEVYRDLGKKLACKVTEDGIVYGRRDAYVAPQKVLRYFGIAARAINLVNMNDLEKLTFAQIADKLEAEWL